jgi:hypothetical protein
MKNKIAIAVASVCLAVSAFAASPSYKTLTDYGNAASPSEVVFPEVANNQWRIVSVNYSSDTNNAVLSFSGGAQAYRIVQTNAATTSVTNLINSTNGLTASSVLLLNRGGTYYAATISSWASSSTTVTNSGLVTGGTNVVLASGGWGVATQIGDPVYLMDTATTIPVGAATNAINGEAIYVGALPGRPVRVVLTPASTTNKLNAVTGRSE